MDEVSVFLNRYFIFAANSSTLNQEAKLHARPLYKESRPPDDNPATRRGSNWGSRQTANSSVTQTQNFIEPPDP